ncbi:hypothetical protein BS50DRAFT_578937 [Corynespora cassiicola Philippines]|uniref:Capsule polysaccharide biosynthesis protein n=1 Tax=Corynespora cassiicola Philippines TaxID=1448308 RepID=A0A2T2N5U0_CORCC|nr:hypothetical protein BS50DRAFT_578937 [Corynespora cassiicola Philippines]
MMAKIDIQIPEEFKSQLRHVDAKDKRSDAEILESLTQHVPITSEKNIWTYWHSGVLNMPKWCQRNIINWVRLHGSDWSVRVLDTVPDSPNHALKWISPDQLPEAFVKGTMSGPYVGPHSADFLRGAALYRYGGAWSDVGDIIFLNLDKICWDRLSDDSNPFTVSVPWMYSRVMANHFVAARKGDEFIKIWHELFTHFWKGQTDFKDIVQNPLMTFVQQLAPTLFADSAVRGFNWDFKIDPVFLLGYIGQCSAWLRLAWLKEPNGGFDGADYYSKKILLFDSLEEDWAAEKTIGYSGVDLFKVFTTRRDADPESEDYKKAYAATWRMLTKSAMQKITHGKGLTHTPHCGALLDLTENEGKDYAPGTFGELIRYGSVYLEQTRDEIAYVDPVEPEPEQIMHKGIYEP